MTTPWIFCQAVGNLKDWGKHKLSSKNRIVGVKGKEVETILENINREVRYISIRY